MLTRASVILWERTGHWATAMLRDLPAVASLVQVRGADDCRRQLDASPASIVAVELTAANVAQVAELAGEISARYPHAAVVALGEPSLVHFRPALLEAGVMHVFDSPRELAGWRQTVANHLKRIPTDSGDVAQCVWQSLPWRGAATT